MITSIIPKLPMRNKAVTKNYYCNELGFKDIENSDFEGYLMLYKESVEIHFFEHTTLNPKENYGQVYIRANKIENLYQSFIEKKVEIHPNGKLELKPWRQKEFSILDPDNNLITFGESLI